MTPLLKHPQPPQASLADFDLTGEVRRAVLPIADGLVVAPTLYDISCVVREIFERTYPLVAMGFDAQGFIGRDVADARHDAAFSIPIGTLHFMELCISNEPLLPVHVRESFGNITKMLLHHLDPTAPPQPSPLWKDEWLRHFDHDVRRLALERLSHWTTPPPKRDRIVVSSDVLRARDQRLVRWQAHKRAEAERGHWKPGRGKTKPWTIDYFCAEARVDRAEFGRWHRGELAVKSATTQRIEQELSRPFSGLTPHDILLGE